MKNVPFDCFVSSTSMKNRQHHFRLMAWQNGDRQDNTTKTKTMHSEHRLLEMCANKQQKVKLSSKWVRGSRENPFTGKWIAAVVVVVVCIELKMKWKKKQRATQRKSHFLCDFIAQLLDKRHFFQLIVYERHTRIIPRCPPKYVSIVRTLSRCRCLLLRSFYGRKLKLIKILAQFFSPFPSRPVLHFDAYSMHIRTTPVQSQLVWRELWYEEKKKEKRRRETKE